MPIDEPGVQRVFPGWHPVRVERRRHAWWQTKGGKTSGGPGGQGQAGGQGKPRGQEGVWLVWRRASRVAETTRTSFGFIEGLQGGKLV